MKYLREILRVLKALISHWTNGEGKDFDQVNEEEEMAKSMNAQQKTISTRKVSQTFHVYNTHQIPTKCHRQQAKALEDVTHFILA